MPITIIYDGDCPLCTIYVNKIRLEETVGPIELINARLAPNIRTDLAGKNIDLDKGMVLIVEGRYYHGDECLHRLALMTNRIGWFNQLNYWVFRSKYRTAVLYPVLRSGRNALLWLQGRKKFRSFY